MTSPFANKKALSFVLVFFLLAICVHADYNFYDELGNNMKYTGTFSTDAATSYNAIQIPTATATFTEPIAFDSNNDGVTEVFIQETGTVGLYRMSSTDATNIGTFGGEQAISPVACDIDNDGRKDYLSVYDVGNATWTLAAANYNTGGVFTVFSQRNVTETNAYGNMQCGPFYAAQGDTRNYVMWVDNDKLLWIMTSDGAGGFTGINVSVDDALTQEANFPYPRGSHRVIFDQNIDPTGDGTIFFYAGHKAFAYFSDGGEDSITIQPGTGSGGYNASNAALGTVKVFGPITAGGQAFAVQWDDDGGTGTSDQPREFYRIVRVSSFPFRTLSAGAGSAFNISLGTIFAVTDGVAGPTGFAKYNTSDGSDSLFVRVWETNAASGRTSTNAASTQSRFIRATTAGTIITTSSLALTPTNAGDAKSKGLFLADMNKDGIIDYITTRNNGASGNYTVGYYDGRANYASGNFTAMATIPTTAPIFELPFQTVDMNNDGAPDLIISGLANGEIYVVMSSAFGGQNNIPFSVSLNNTLPFVSNQKITMASNSTDFNYNYAAICDVGDDTIWNEQFLLGYNFTTQNVSLNVFPPEDFLVYNGLSFPINATFPQFDLFKQGNAGIREISKVKLQYTAPTNSTVDLLVFGSDNQVTYYLRINKTGSSLNIGEVAFGGNVTNIANATITGNSVPLSILFTPVDSIYGNYFDTNIIIGNATVGTGSTSLFGGSNLQNAEVFSDSEGTLLLTSIGLFKTNNPEPGFVEFQNGQIITSMGVTVTNPPPQSRIQGDGYQVVPNFNNVFYSTCSYTQLGTYLQRHFIAPTGQFGDYSNFRDLTVTVTNSTTNSEGQDTGSGLTGLDALLDQLGIEEFISAQGLAFVIALIVIIGFSALAFKVHWILGSLTFISLVAFSTFAGFLPIWVALVLVIMCGAIVAIAFRAVFSGE